MQSIRLIREMVPAFKELDFSLKTCNKPIVNRTQILNCPIKVITLFSYVLFCLIPIVNMVDIMKQLARIQSLENHGHRTKENSLANNHLVMSAILNQ